MEGHSPGWDRAKGTEVGQRTKKVTGRQEQGCAQVLPACSCFTESKSREDVS